MKSIIFSIVLLIPLVVTNEVTEIECHFAQTSGDIYRCWLPRSTRIWHRNQNVIFTGNHLEGHTHANVTGLILTWDSASITPHVLRQAFDAFPNLRNYQTIQAELEEIRSGDFANAVNLEYFSIDQNPLLTTIPARAFVGASNLKIVTLRENGITTIHVDAFAGNDKLEQVELSSNPLKVLPENIFRQLPSLKHVGMSRTLIETLSSRIFANNPNMEVFDFFGCRIDAIEKHFFDNYENLQILLFGNNQCINGMFWVTDENPIEKILPEFETCFNNFDMIDDETNMLTLQLRGSLVIRDQDGDEIVRLDTGNKSKIFGVASNGK